MKISFTKRTAYHGWLEYFYWIFLFSFIIISILGGVLYLYMSSLLKDEAIEKNSNTLSQLKNAQEAVLSETDLSISGIVLDSIIANYMDYYKANDTLMMTASQNKLDSVRSLYDSVDSLYVWYLQDNMVLSSDQGAIPFDQYEDPVFISKLKTVHSLQSFSRVIKSSYGQQQLSVISLVNTIPIYVTTDSPKALVVFNLKSKTLEKSLDSIRLGSHSSILVTDQDGEIIMKKAEKNETFSDDLLSEIKMQDSQETNSFIDTVNGEKALVSFINSDKYGWRYIYITPMSTITAGIRFLGIITALLSFCFILLSLFGALFLSHKFYSPIKASLALFDTDRQKSEPKKTVKDTALLQNNIRKIIRKKPEP